MIAIYIQIYLSFSYILLVVYVRIHNVPWKLQHTYIYDSIYTFATQSSIFGIHLSMQYERSCSEANKLACRS